MNSIYGSSMTIGETTIIVDFEEGDDELPPFWGVWTSKKSDEYVSTAGYLCKRLRCAYKTSNLDDAEVAAGMIADSLKLELVD
jgi:hypothetical protein